MTQINFDLETMLNDMRLGLDRKVKEIPINKFSDSICHDVIVIGDYAPLIISKLSDEYYQLNFKENIPESELTCEQKYGAKKLFARKRDSQYYSFKIENDSSLENKDFIQNNIMGKFISFNF